jgi:hypothetical protein
VNEALIRGLDVLLTVHRTPDWANGGQGTGVPPDDPADFAAFAGWLAGHFRGRVSAYEVWNEPDPRQSYWTGTVAQYVELLRRAYVEFKRADPAAEIVLGGPSSNDAGWIAEVYAAGAKPYFDVLATHPYQAVADKPPEHEQRRRDARRHWLTDFPSVRDVMARHGDSDKEVWFTEFGWSSHPNGEDLQDWQLGVSERQQAEFLVRALRHIDANYGSVTRAYWYNERNRTDSDIHTNNYGLLRADLSPKPVYEAVGEFTG